ncbi:hypothetical protein XA68_13132 [Ophiocordyceps unilateralis]|uniref:Uncharacterized protein n=1 Tax=Ophiocordyceps unilateralis TaxID=268505 RepID=A0A2A9PNU0_OPHUN|nr:hypothetical protein XA68_13132 [Ophiocordyceps unilateralis]
MAAMPTAADDEEVLRSSCLSASAQTRILIWRSEVASAFDPPLLPPSSASSSSVPSAHSSSSTAASSSLLPSSRGRRFWRRIVRRLSSRPDPAPSPESARAAVVAALLAAEAAAAGGAPAKDPPTEHDQDSRTAMYRFMPPLHGHEQPLDGHDSHHGALKQKQERLHRAAKLLLQQNTAGPSIALAH